MSFELDLQPCQILPKYLHVGYGAHTVYTTRNTFREDNYKERQLELSVLHAKHPVNQTYIPIKY